MVIGHPKNSAGVFAVTFPCHTIGSIIVVAAVIFLLAVFRPAGPALPAGDDSPHCTCDDHKYARYAGTRVVDAEAGRGLYRGFGVVSRWPAGRGDSGALRAPSSSKPSIMTSVRRSSSRPVV